MFRSSSLPYLDSSGSRRLDREAIERLGIPGTVLMENAGRALARLVRSLLPSPSCPTVLLCGRGNNGGDGFVAARWLQTLGRSPIVGVLGSPENSPPSDALTNLHRLRGVGVPVTEIHRVEDFVPLLPSDFVGVDCLFGTGLTRPVDGLARACLELLDERSSLKVAADLPSGIDASTGAVLGFAPRCQVTLSFLSPKQAWLSDQAAPFLGTTLVDTLGLPAEWIRETVATWSSSPGG